MIRLEHTKYDKHNKHEKSTGEKEKENKDKKEKKKKKRWQSPTSINSYLYCPRKFYLSKIAKLKQKPSIHLIRGNAVHSAIEKFYKHRINRCANMDYTELRQIVADLFRGEWENKKDDFKTLDLAIDEIDFFYIDSQKMMLNFLDDFIRDRGFEKPDPVIEKTLFSHKYLLLARLDKIEKHALPHYVEDFKTSKSIEITPEIKRQMGICALLYEEVYKKKPVLGVNFLKFRNGKRIVNISDDYIDKIKSLILEVHTRTQSEHIKDYPCTCGWCNKNYDVDSLCQSLI